MPGMDGQAFVSRFCQQFCSTSLNACLIRLIGGPADGALVLQDFEFHELCYYDIKAQHGWTYRKGTEPRTMVFDREYGK
jgi:hypothetical protein